MLDLDVASKNYEQIVFDTALEIVYPVAFKRLRDEGPKKVTRSTGDLYRQAITMKKWNASYGKEYMITLEPEKKPSMPKGMDKTHKAGIKR